ncbi:MAG: hypothetical protein V7L11_11710 [Nostoc sp.]|uniref:hypothetical protein n=1 Tax=Nostoc sp. TaxID=1180 RepID=UPI002FF96D0A
MVNSARKIPVEVYLNIQNLVASQDIAIVNSQQPRRLPLNLQAEVHLPSDRKKSEVKYYFILKTLRHLKKRY